ncbi:MAG: hypothetical protein JNM34_12820, partial [Chthonomonadaceae bacterium]|nr:hypothetical protein [Chthonomonadaceae bacterium]
MELDALDKDIQRQNRLKRFVNILAFACVLLVSLPALIGWISCPTGSLYFGIQSNFDDQMVYAAWMRQAMDGAFLFDNRFAIDQQPGLTLHVFFLLLGWLAKFVGIAGSMTLARVGLTWLFVQLLGRFVISMKVEVFRAKYMLLLSCFGGGVGFLSWERFGQETVNAPAAVKAMFLGLCPIDVWQPEAFVFPSMLTNALFLAALCLIVIVLRCVVDCRHGWGPAIKGSIAFCLLMNIHSYDVLLLSLVAATFVIALVFQKSMTGVWLARLAVIACGAIPPSLWFLHVLSVDPVFQARAATLTYSPTFRQVVLGLLPGLGLGLYAAFTSSDKWRRGAAGLATVVILALVVASTGQDPGRYFMTWAPWGLTTVVMVLAGIGLTKKTRNSDGPEIPEQEQHQTMWTLLWCWALVGLVAIYFPSLFQRKLAMGLVVPWAMLASYGLAHVLSKFDRSTRNLVATLSLCLTSGSSLAWFMREIYYIRNNVSRTTVQSVYFSRDVDRIIDELNIIKGRKIVLAMPGVASPVVEMVDEKPTVTDFKA